MLRNARIWRFRHRSKLNACRFYTKAWDVIKDKLCNQMNTSHVFRSTSTNPYLNLAIEHEIFKVAPSGVRVLFLYVNEPCVVIGRFQNPWLEVDLLKLQRGISRLDRPGTTPIHLVRRLSGGGTVFHDEGNVNWSVLCAQHEFFRDKHAEMVVRCLRNLSIGRARVNERHDIVLDQGEERREVDVNDTHITPFTDDASPSLKVSGSAYKIAKNKALHHGTALAKSSNLGLISEILQSPARPYISAKGTESVRSPVTNISVETMELQTAIESEYRILYGETERSSPTIEIGHDALRVKAIRSGYNELRVSVTDVLDPLM
jgi:lipoate-protein ligase A